MTLEHREDVIVDALNDLPAYAWGKPVIASIVFALATHDQEIEDVLWEVLNKRTLDNAVEGQLETLGLLVGESRLGKTDDEYRVAIRGRILVNRSHGHYDDLTDLLELMRPGVSYCVTEGDAALDIFFDDLEYSLTAVVLPFLRDSAGAGIKVNLVSPASADSVFTLCAVAEESTDGTTTGFSAISAPTTGGALAMVIE